VAAIFGHLTRLHRLSGAVVLSLLGSGVVLVFAARDSQLDDWSPIATMLDIAVAHHEARGADTVLDLRHTGTLTYDHMFVFEPYTTRGAVHRALGSRATKAENRAISGDDGKFLLVFMRRDAVVSAFRYARTKIDFGCVPARMAGPRTRARFRLTSVPDFAGLAAVPMHVRVGDAVSPGCLAPRPPGR
jgi:hypothetical protein